MKLDSTSGTRILSRKNRAFSPLVLAMFLVLSTSPQSFANEKPQQLLMTPEMVASIPADQRVIVDTRPAWKFMLSHIPGAINLNDWWEFTHKINGVKGLLRDDINFIKDKLAPLGLSPDKTIVIYGQTDDPWRTDGRFFWMFERYGFTKVALLDGGFDSWKRSGKKTQRGRHNPTPISGPININLNNEVIADKHLISKVYNSNQFALIDNRTKKEYLGATPYGSDRGGHIPNATHIHWPYFFNADGTLMALPALNSLLGQHGIRPDQEIIVYCTGGVRSAMAYFVFRYLGYKVRNYDGSWWDWSQSSFPVEQSG